MCPDKLKPFSWLIWLISAFLKAKQLFIPFVRVKMLTLKHSCDFTADIFWFNLTKFSPIAIIKNIKLDSS